MQWPQDYLLALMYLMQIGVSLIGMFWILLWLMRDSSRPEPGPDQFDLFIKSHAPAWLKRILKQSLYTDEAAIIAVLIAAVIIGSSIWLFGAATR